MKVAIVGYARDGKASAEYWRELGDSVTVCDENEAITKDLPSDFASQLGPDYLKNLHAFDLIVRTSGMHPRTIIDANPDHPEIAERITTSINEFIRVCRTENIIGVTGTKGKGTTSTLAAKMLEAAGKTVHLGGNIGIAMLGFVHRVKPSDWVVTEMSSFQLYDLKRSVHTGVCLSVTPEHLNWHDDLEDYHSAKANLFRLQQPGDQAIYNALSETAKDIASAGPGEKIAYEVPPLNEQPTHKEGAYVSGGHLYHRDTQIMPIKDIVLPGRFNLENICAALTAVWPAIDNNIEAIKKVLTTFTGLEEHLELIGEVDGVKYYNDTYATAPDAAMAAMSAFAQPKVMILGGIDKQVPLGPMADAIVASNVRGVVLIDDLADQLMTVFKEREFENAVLGGSTMTEIVARARELAQPGDVVLLSPGAAGNGGMFIDKLDRGHQFNHAVEVLQASGHN